MSDFDIEKGGTETTPPNERNQAPVQRIKTSGANNEIVHIGDTMVYKDEFIRAFGGSLVPGLMHRPVHKFANPAPLGLCAFSLTTFVLSLCNAQARSVTTPNIVVGLAFFYGGLIQLLAGMWEMAVENTFGATALSSFGGFWMSYACIQIDGFGIVSAYGDNKSELQSAIGFYLIAWFIFTFILVLCTVKSTVAFCALFSFLDLTFLMLAIGEFQNSIGCTKAGGVLGVITAFIGWYNAYAGIANHENSYLSIRPFYLPGSQQKPSDTKK